MKPVAKVEIGSPWLTVEELMPLSSGMLLYTADQLRQAKVEVLREAIAMWSVRGRIATDYEDVVRTDELRRMADEIERSKA